MEELQTKQDELEQEVQRLKRLLKDAKGNPANVVIELEQQLQEKEEQWN